MLLTGYTWLNSNPGREIGGASNPYKWMKVSSSMMFYTGDHVIPNITKKANLYTGYRAPYVLSLSLSEGEIAATGGLEGQGVLSTSMSGGVNIESALSGQGLINTANASLIAYAVSALLGTGTLSADIVGKLEAAAALSGSGDINGALGLLSSAVASIIGTSSVSGDITGSLDASASLVGIGQLIADVSSLLYIQAALSGVGNISSDISAAANASASLLGQGDIVGAIQTIAHIESQLAGIGTFNITSTTIPGFISADITLSTALSPDTLAAAVWNAVAANFNSPGTMGEKVNDAGSASNPWTEIIEGSYTASDILKLMAAVLAGKSTIVDNGDGTKTVTFRAIDDSADRIEAEIENSERTTVVLTP